MLNRTNASCHENLPHLELPSQWKLATSRNTIVKKGTGNNIITVSPALKNH